MSRAPQGTGSAATPGAASGSAMSPALMELYRRVRESQRAVWEPASIALGEQSAENPEAFATLRELLISAVPELRIRGVVGLGALAPARPAEVGAFLEDRLTERSSVEDPILLEAILCSAARLPGSEGGAFFGRCLTDPRPSLRAAALSALEHRSRWPMDRLQGLAQDPSPEVRSALALLLAPRAQDPTVFEVLGTLVQDGDPLVRAAVAAGLGEDSSQTRFLRMTLEADPEEGVRQALGVPVPRASTLREDPERPGLQTALGLEAEIDADPTQALDLLRPWLGRAGTLNLLKALGELCRDPQAGWLVRGLHVLLASSEEDYGTRVLRMLGILQDAPAGSAAAELKCLVSMCLGLYEAESIEELAAWAGTVPPANAVALDPPAWEVMEKLARFCRGLGSSPGLLPLSKAVANVENLLQIGDSCLRPESELLRPALEKAVDILSGHLNQLMSGADN